ncbi:MAG TPA: hypothetical protein VMR45_04610 [Patescibacteria group bacterium]|nr:hypothetical protein [Patescibacteria group bacterium]
MQPEENQSSVGVVTTDIHSPYRRLTNNQLAELIAAVPSVDTPTFRLHLDNFDDSWLRVIPQHRVGSAREMLRKARVEFGLPATNL